MNNSVLGMMNWPADKTKAADRMVDDSGTVGFRVEIIEPAEVVVPIHRKPLLFRPPSIAHIL